jgi:hypothetical protein
VWCPSYIPYTKSSYKPKKKRKKVTHTHKQKQRWLKESKKAYRVNGIGGPTVNGVFVKIGLILIQSSSV